MRQTSKTLLFQAIGLHEMHTANIYDDHNASNPHNQNPRALQAILLLLLWQEHADIHSEPNLKAMNPRN